MRLVLGVIVVCIAACGGQAHEGYVELPGASRGTNEVAVPYGRDVAFPLADPDAGGLEFRTFYPHVVAAWRNGDDVIVRGIADWFDYFDPTSFRDDALDPSTYVFPVVDGIERYEQGFNVRVVGDVAGEWLFVHDDSGWSIEARIRQDGAIATIAGFPSRELVDLDRESEGMVVGRAITFDCRCRWPPLVFRLRDRGTADVEFSDGQGLRLFFTAYRRR